MTVLHRARHRLLPVAAILLGGAGVAQPAAAIDLQRPEVRSFIEELVKKDGFEAQYVEAVLGGVETQPKVVSSTSRPAERIKPWRDYRAIFLTPRRIAAGVDFYREHETSLRKIAAATGVPAEIICAILGVETFYGTRTGGFRVIDSLTTLAFDYPPRAKFFRGELRSLFLLGRDERIDVTTITGSYAGAVGPPQFIPSSYRAYAVDGDGDGKRNLLSDWDDIFASVANYFVAHDWQRGQPVAIPAQLRSAAATPDDANDLVIRDTVGSLGRQGVLFTSDLPETAPAMLMLLDGDDGAEYWVGFQNFYSITRYNRSTMYALAVYQLSEAIAAGAGLRTSVVTDAGAAP